MPKHEPLAFLLADVLRLMRRRFRERIQDSRLTPAQAKTLVAVSRREGIRQVDLAELLELQPITLVRLLDQLVAAGVVERRRDPADRRAYRIHLTKAAGPHLAEITRLMREIHSTALRGLDAQQAGQLRDGLLAMRENLVTR